MLADGSQWIRLICRVPNYVCEPIHLLLSIHPPHCKARYLVIACVCVCEAVLLPRFSIVCFNNLTQFYFAPLTFLFLSGVFCLAAIFPDPGYVVRLQCPRCHLPFRTCLALECFSGSVCFFFAGTPSLQILMHPFLVRSSDNFSTNLRHCHSNSVYITPNLSCPSSTYFSSTINGGDRFFSC